MEAKKSGSRMGRPTRGRDISHLAPLFTQLVAADERLRELETEVVSVRAERVRLIHELAEQGATNRVIAESIGSTSSAIATILSRYPKK